MDKYFNPSRVWFLLVCRWTRIAFHSTAIGDCGSFSGYEPKVSDCNLDSWDYLFSFLYLLWINFLFSFFIFYCRGTQVGVILSLVIAGYLAFQHFSRTGSLKNAFDQGSIVATLAIICISIVPCLLLIWL